MTHKTFNSTLGHKISPRLAQLIWNAVPKLAPFITNLTCVTDGKVDPGFDTMDMPKLEYLTIEADTDKFPVFVLGVPSLKELIITNKANEVPSGISKLVNLEKLSLYMPIAEIPEEIFTLKNLKSLFVRKYANNSAPAKPLANWKTLPTSVFITIRGLRHSLKVYLHYRTYLTIIKRISGLYFPLSMNTKSFIMKWAII